MNMMIVSFIFQTFAGHMSARPSGWVLLGHRGTKGTQDVAKNIILDVGHWVAHDDDDEGEDAHTPLALELNYND